jgi:asparagine synthase (glutamine-hydrolysing)
MCGIAGAIDDVAARAVRRVSALNNSQKHRGPDHEIVATIGAFTIGNTRLAIQDPSPAGNQPFVSPDGRYHCVFNGEIYNYRRLIKRYQLQVRTSCDGEVIPALWAKLGIDSLAELRGMFAIAVVDCLEERLYLARDIFGIKPLYWRTLSDGSLTFASEVRPLVRIAPGAKIDAEAVSRYLHLGAMAPDQAPFLEIKVLPPNSVATFDRDRRVTVRSILPDSPLIATDSIADLGSTLSDSVELHLGSDVPTALLLSSGVDSATIAALGRGLGRDLNCLTIATSDITDESNDAAKTARHYGHSFQRINATLEVDDVARFFGAMQRPSIDGLNTYLVSKAVHEAGFKVALSGLGGDEVVGGYSHFRLLKCLPALRVARELPPQLTAAVVRLFVKRGVASEAKAMRLLGKPGPRDGRHLSLLQREVFPASLAANLTGNDHGPMINNLPDAPRKSFAEQFSAMVATEVAIYLQAMLLPDADSFSMASSVELRVPFVDAQVFQAALLLAADIKDRPGKRSIGAALDDPYLRSLATKPKRGFSVPMQQWMSGPLAPVLKRAVAPDAAVWSVVDRTVAERADLVPLSARARWAEPWALAALNAWLETIDSEVTGQ